MFCKKTPSYIVGLQHIYQESTIYDKWAMTERAYNYNYTLSGLNFSQCQSQYQNTRTPIYQAMYQSKVRLLGRWFALGSCVGSVDESQSSSPSCPANPRNFLCTITLYVVYAQTKSLEL